MSFTFRPSLVRQVKSYAAHTPLCTENTLDCSLGVNPYGAPAAAGKALHTFDAAHLPDYPHAAVLHQALVQYWQGITAVREDEIILANGSICGLYTLNNIFSQTQRRKVVGFIPTFTDMVESVRSFGMDYVPVSARMDENGRMAAEDLLDAVSHETALIYIDRPNNPTGQVMPLSDVERVLRKAREAGCFVLVDEAYGDFIPREESAMTLRSAYPELLLIRTFSKGFGLANLRCGYIVADSRLCDCMNRTLNPYILSDLDRQICAAALSDASHPTAHAEEFARVKKALAQACGEELVMLETDGRVPICTLMCRRQANLQALLMEQDVLTVSGAEFEPLDERYVRLRIPTAEYTQRLTDAIRAAAGHP